MCHVLDFSKIYFKFPEGKKGSLMVTTRQAWIGFVVLLLVVLLVIVATMYWQHVTGMNYLHVLADNVDKPISQGC